MINPQWLELPMSLTIFYGPKDVRAIEVRLYLRTEKAPDQTVRELRLILSFAVLIRQDRSRDKAKISI